MSNDSSGTRRLEQGDLIEVFVRVGLLFAIVVLCARIFAPFFGLMLWALILAIALYPIHQKLAGKLGGRQGRAATTLVLSGLILIGAPTVLLGVSFAEQIFETHAAFTSNSVTVAPPDPAVAEWPVIGERVYAAWSQAADDLPAFLQKMQPQLGNFAAKAKSLAQATAGALFLFLGALIIAGVMMAYGKSGSAAMLKIICRLAGPEKGPPLQRLSVATVRSVASGVIGVAFIQSLLLGIGFVLADIPAAGLLALVTMLLGIMQIPAAVVFIPAIAYIWGVGDGSMVINVVLTVYLFVAGLADNVLKPMLLGRGVDAPMPVILLGALGGMVAAGIVGLFVGAVVLAVGYQVFMAWVDEGTEQAEGA